MRKYLLLAILLVFAATTYGQQYPLVTIQDIQTVPDSLVGTDPKSPLQGDTVRVQGLVMVRPVVDPNTDRRVIISAGNRYSIYIQDPNGAVWGGLNILQTSNNPAFTNGTFFDLADTAQVWEFTGKVNEFFTSTQVEILIDSLNPTACLYISDLPSRPAPIELNLSDLFTPAKTYNFDAEKYEGMYVIFRNIIVSDVNANGNFKINDGQGHFAFNYNQSSYFKTGTAGLIPGYQPPVAGSVLEYLRGIVSTRVDGYYIVPLYPGDIGPVLQSAPVVSSIRRNLSEITPNTPVEVSARIVDLDGTVTNAEIRYRVDGGARLSVPMTWSASDSLYKGTIPGVTSDSAIVDFYFWARDNENLTSNTPPDTVTQMYFYPVLNRPITIKDVQYSPFGSGFSGYNNYRVSFSGVVTADTSDIPGFGTTSLRVYVQNGEGPWSGIQIGTSGSLGIDVLNLKKGDNVTLSGLVRDVFDVTRIDSLTQITVNSSGNPLPNFKSLSTNQISTGGNNALGKEEWESVLVEYPTVSITNINADGTSNFGEMFVSDGSGNTRVELEEGNHSYHNGTRIERPILVLQGATMQSVRGVLYYSFGNYKLVPRKNDDFVSYVTSIKADQSLPNSYGLSQNYPNPFNPSTTINYSLPREEFVTINIYNILGQVVKTLVNQNQSAGNYKVSFDAKDLTSGIYFYNIKAGSFNQVKKMMLVK